MFGRKVKGHPPQSIFSPSSQSSSNSLSASNNPPSTPQFFTPAELSITKNELLQEKKVLRKTDRHLAEFHAKFPSSIQEIIQNQSNDINAGINESGRFCWIAVNNDRESFYYFWDCLKGDFEVQPKETEPLILVFRLPTNRSLLSNLALVVNLGNELGFLAVAQDGAIRFWLNLDSEDFSQASVPLNVGSFVTHLVDCKEAGIVFCSSDGSLYRIFIRGGILSDKFAKCFKNTQGRTVFQSLGKMIWGSKLEKVRKILSGRISEHEQELYILKENSLEKWDLNKENILFEAPLQQMIRQRMIDDENKNSNSTTDLYVWLIDMETNNEKDKLYILVGSVAMNVPEDHIRLLTYSIIEITNIHTFFPIIGEAFSLKYQPSYDPRDPKSNELLNLAHLIITRDTYDTYVYHPDIIILTKIPHDDRELDFLKLSTINDYVLGFGKTTRKALFISAKNGIVALSQFGLKEKKSTATGVQFFGTEDIVSHLATAFRTYFNITYFGGDKQQVLDQINPLLSLSVAEFETAVLEVAKKILDAPSTSEERWSEPFEKRNENLHKTYILVAHQLEEKKKKIDLFFRFLDLQLQQMWVQVSLGVKQQLMEYSLQISAAINLKNVQNKESKKLSGGFEGFLRRAIDSYIHSNFGSSFNLVNTGLTNTDTFYTNITKIHLIIFEVVNIVTQTPSRETFAQFFQEIRDANKIILAILQPLSVEPIVPFHLGINQAIETEIEASFTFFEFLGIQEIASEDLDAFVADLFQLSKVFLQIHYFMNSPQSRTVESQTKFFEFSGKIISGFEKINQLKPTQAKYALELAEAFRDFRMLAHLLLNNHSLLLQKMEQYRREGFHNHVFKCLLDENKFSQLLSLPSSFDNDLSIFFQTNPSLGFQISWLHNSKLKELNSEQEYAVASDTLLSLAAAEVDIVHRKKTLLSLSKLNEIATERPREEIIDRIERELNIITYQEVLSSRETSVLPPEQLIQIALNSDLEGDPVKSVIAAFEIWDQYSGIANQPEWLFYIWHFSFCQTDWLRLIGQFNSVPEEEIMVQITSSLFFEVARSDLLPENAKLNPQLLHSIFQQNTHAEGLFDLINRCLIEEKLI